MSPCRLHLSPAPVACLSSALVAAVQSRCGKHLAAAPCASPAPRAPRPRPMRLAAAHAPSHPSRPLAPRSESWFTSCRMPYRPTERTEARREATRERIVTAALDQVAHGKYASAGIQQVAARAGIAVGTVYRYFPSKGDLFAEAFRRAAQRELDVVIAVSEADGRPAVERIGASVEAFARRALAGPVLAYALLAE